ncbi:hypothetical protein HMPREF9151_00012 [Hoylesella saccharolytica F0055]|uniref:Uncharacterized protein n=1 Tax=Hoylesella saccharolytica F0055 TaxID=1127699 RepID=L1NM48_9BACT|nr:hypothetical protein HMPREF9151_00012 [Hoylesella saccharolytica F0055]
MSPFSSLLLSIMGMLIFPVSLQDRSNRECNAIDTALLTFPTW